jgi:hypothetical protein
VPDARRSDHFYVNLVTAAECHPSSCMSAFQDLCGRARSMAGVAQYRVGMNNLSIALA